MPLDRDLASARIIGLVATAALTAALASSAHASGTPAPALTAGPQVKLADPPFTSFTGRSLVVVDLDGSNGPDLAGVAATNVVIKLRQPDGTFPTQQSLPMGSTLEVLESADLDGDTRPDLVATSIAGRALVSRLNLGGGAFAAPITLPTGGRPYNLALGDLNGDGRADAVTVLHDSALVEVSLNDGAGSLQIPARIPVATDSRIPSIGDFTGDGIPDVLVASLINTCVFTVLPGIGDGTFGAGIVSSVSIPYRISLAAADLDGDGDRDLAVFHSTGVDRILNQGNGAFAQPLSLGLPAGSYDANGGGRVTMGDVDRDGHPDVAVALRRGAGWGEENLFSVAINRGDATFHPVAYYHVGMAPQDAALADLDGDGWLEGITNTAKSAQCCETLTGPVPAFAFLLKNSGAGAFDAHLELREPVWVPLRISGSPADLLGSSGGQLQRASNRGNATFLSTEALGRGFPWRTCDLDGDGNDEVVVTSADSLWVLLGLGGGSLSSAGSLTTGLVPRDIADFDADGDLDLLATDAALQLKVLPGDGAGAFGAPLDFGFTLRESPQDGSTRGRDVNGDGFADLLFLPTRGQGDWSGQNPVVYVAWLQVALNNGAGQFGPVDSFAVQFANSSPRANTLNDLAIGDFDGDHVPDVAVVAAACGSDLSGWWGVWRGLGDGSFVAFGSGSDGGNSPCHLAAGDLNGDGLDDLVRTNANGGYTFRATTMTALGGGAFSTTGVYQMGDLTFEVSLADMDGDGRLDVVTRGARHSTVSIRRNVTEFDLPTPALLSLAAIHYSDGAVYLDWFSGGDAPAGTTLERSEGTSGWRTLAALTPDGTGHLYYIDRDLPAVERLGYRLRWRDESGEHLTAEHWVELPAAAFALRGAWPNPSASAPSIALTLPRAGSVEIEIFDVSGRKVTRETRSGLPAGPQQVALTARSLEPGLYVTRVSYAGQRLQSRFVVVR